MDARPAQAHAPLDHAAILAIMMGIMLAMFLSALEQTIVAPALPTIGRVLGDVENLSWVVTAYLLANTVATPLFGKLSDIHGRRRMMLIAIVIFIAGSVACALAPNMPTLIAARALQGIGGGGILPIAHTIIGDMVSPRERPRYQSYTSIMFMAASIVGPVLGGVLTDYVHWTMIFWINLPLGLLALWMTDRALKKLPRHDRPHRLDVPGALLMVCAALALMLAMTWGGTRYRLGLGADPGIARGARRCCGSLFALAGHARAGAVHPAVDSARADRRRDRGRGLLQRRRHHRAVDLPAALFRAGAGIFAERLGHRADRVPGRRDGRLVHRRPADGAARPLQARAGRRACCSASSCWWCSRGGPAGCRWSRSACCSTVGGTGLGVMYPVTTTIVQNAVAPHQLGIATGALNFARQLGGAIIVAAFGTIVLGGIDTGGHGLTLEMLRGGAQSPAPISRCCSAGCSRRARCSCAAGLVAVLVIEERPLRGPAADRGRIRS